MLERILRAKPYILIIIACFSLSAWWTGIVNPPLWALGVMVGLLMGNTGILIWRQFRSWPALASRT